MLAVCLVEQDWAALFKYVFAQAGPVTHGFVTVLAYVQSVLGISAFVENHRLVDGSEGVLLMGFRHMDQH